MRTSFLETGQTVRWRGCRWRVLGEETGGFIKLAGLDGAIRGIEVNPLLQLERDEILPDEPPLPELAFEASDRSHWRALHRAHQITMAGGREQLVGLDWGAVTVEPYQLVPLLRVARSMQPRLLIADDAGLGKTAEAGAILRWLAQRHQAERVLIVTRASPEPERWHQEMHTKFGFRFDILRSGTDFNERRRLHTENVFAQQDRLIVSMTLAARQAILDELRKCQRPFDVVIVDEAAHLAERAARTKRLAVLGRVLRDQSRDGALLLLTATPHDGKTESFLSLLRLLDPAVEVEPGKVPVDIASRLVVRRLKTEVTLAGGRKFQRPLIRMSSTLDLACRQERALNQPLDAYLDWLADEESRYERAGARQKATGCQFLATLYRKRFGSSVAALRATLRRRLGMPQAAEDADDTVPYVDTDSSDPEDEVIDPGAEAETPPPDLSPAEAELAQRLLDAAEQVPSGRDAKLEALTRLLKNDLSGEKVVVFTEYRDTLRAATRRLRAEGISFVTFHGATPDAERGQALRAFHHDSMVRVFLATDAASEGLNLQRAAHLLVHLDVPWNPNRYVQRNGRIDRYGQGKRPQIWLLTAADGKGGRGRPEARALEIVARKIERIREDVGSAGFALPTWSSRVDQALRAIRRDTPERIDELLDTKVSDQVAEDLSRLAVRNRLEIEEAERYVGRFGTIDDFEAEVGDLLQAAFRGWDDGGAVERVEPGIVRVRVPARLRREAGLPTVIERATFRRDVAVAGEDEDDAEAPEFLSPGHPLVEATLRLLREEGTDPRCPHRFDVEAADREGLVLSFVTRFVDRDGRTVEESLGGVEVALDGTVGTDPNADSRRLGVEASSHGAIPDARRLPPWQARFPELVAQAREEALRRAERRREELVEAAHKLMEEDHEALGRWVGEERARAELLMLGSSQISFESLQVFEQRQREIEVEYQRRRKMLRDRSHIRLANVDLLGGRLLVRGRP